MTGNAPPVPYPFEDKPALNDPFIRGVLIAFALIAFAIGATFIFTPLLRYGLSPWWLTSFIIVHPIIGLLRKEM
jgi:hypothetical protein